MFVEGRLRARGKADFHRSRAFPGKPPLQADLPEPAYSFSKVRAAEEQGLRTGVFEFPREFVKSAPGLFEQLVQPSLAEGRVFEQHHRVRGNVLQKAHTGLVQQLIGHVGQDRDF